MTMPVFAPGPASSNTAIALSVGRRLADASTMCFVSLLSVLLLIFIARGTSER
jgi:hypothetical protein